MEKILLLLLNLLTHWQKNNDLSLTSKLKKNYIQLNYMHVYIKYDFAFIFLEENKIITFTCKQKFLTMNN